MPCVSFHVPEHLAAQLSARGQASDAARECLEWHFALLGYARGRLYDQFSHEDLGALAEIIQAGPHDWSVLMHLEDLPEWGDEAIFGRWGVEAGHLRERAHDLDKLERAALLDGVERYWLARRTGLDVDPGSILARQGDL